MNKCQEVKKVQIEMDLKTFAAYSSILVVRLELSQQDKMRCLYT